MKTKCLPLMYWLPKLHKIPTKVSFIIGVPECSLKPLSKWVFFFKLMIKQIKGYNKQRSFINYQPTSDTIKNLNSRSNATSIICYDFSTLYTNIPHWKLIRILN